jgi:hypothetical protein
LPIRARLPLIAQITGGVALMAALTMPAFQDVAPEGPASAPVAPGAPGAPVAPGAPDAPATPAVPDRPAHLNLDFRHSFGSVDLSLSVDNKRVLDTKLEGAGRKFGVFGKRGERSFTRSIELAPGARVVRIRVKSEKDDFDHTRVERFDLGSAAVAAMRITVDKTGLDVMTDRPPAPPVALAAPTPAPPTSAAVATTAATAAAVTQSSALAELYHTLRQLLIALAGFIASVASGFLFEEYMKSRNLSPFKEPAPGTAADRSARRRRIRRQQPESDISIDAGLS